MRLIVRISVEDYRKLKLDYIIILYNMYAYMCLICVGYREMGYYECNY